MLMCLRTIHITVSMKMYVSSKLTEAVFNLIMQVFISMHVLRAASSNMFVYICMLIGVNIKR